MKHSIKLSTTSLLFSLIILFSCQKETTNASTDESASIARFEKKGIGLGTTSRELVFRWNDAATYVVLKTLQVQPTPRIPPFRESHYYAMVNIAVHDALNNIVPKYKSYALNARDKDADPGAAVAQAAHDVITFFFRKLNPPANNTPQLVQDSIHNLLTQSLNSIPNGEAKSKGIALGVAAAQAIIQNRANDGSANAIYQITQGTQPREYRSTAPFHVNGFYDSPGWGDVKTFGIQNSTQFAVPAPYTVNSAEYTEDYNEVKRLGCLSCTGEGKRTKDQENIAKFWVESSAYGWNKAAKEIIEQKNMDAWKIARLFALLQMSVADAYIASLKAKMIHFFWRPVTSIQLGDNDGNPNTVGDPDWQVLWFPTPPITDHPSAHATAGGAAAELMKNFFQKDNFSFSFESITLPGNPRSFSSLSQAARENSLSRIYVGYHFRKACFDGEALGRSVGDWIATNALQEN
jgi:PAP2 superfamily